MSKHKDRQDLQNAVSLHQAGRLDEAAAIYRRLIKADRYNFQALHFLGVIEASVGNFDEARHLMQRSLAMQPPNIQFMENYAAILFQMGDYASALEICGKGLQLNRNSISLLYISAVALFKLNQLDEAIGQFDAVLSRQPNHIEAINERGSVLAEQKKYDEALASFDKALALQPNYAAAHLNKGNLYGAMKRYDEAFAAYDKALAIKPDFAEAWLGRGNILRDLKRHAEAFAAYDKALAIKPNLAEAWFARGNVLREIKHHDEALGAYAKALQLNPGLAEAWVGRANVFAALKRHDEANAAIDNALAIKSDLAEAWLSRGEIFWKLERHDEAIAAYDKALAIKPDLEGAEGARLNAKMRLCDWSNLAAECERLIASVRKGVVTSPFPLLSFSSSSDDLLQCTRSFNTKNFPKSDQPLWRGERCDHGRIRVAYLSSDLRDHPVAYLTAGLFEQHDRSRFELTAISHGPPQNSELRRRLEGAFDHFIEASSYDDRKIAELMRQSEIDIAVDLNGYTEGARSNVFALRPAPVQINYLGYAGTMGADYFDYIIADPTVVPDDQFQHFSEKVVWLPDSYMVSDRKRKISERTLGRAECGLPENAFVFCCFNNQNKIQPEIFRLWMRLLTSTEGSVLWLSEGNAVSMANLRREASACGVAPERLVFAAKLPDIADHLARQRQADLFLDTLPYNAHATANDALWAGLPVLTCLGSTFASRVAGSLLKAVGLPELVTASLADYEALALKLVHDPALLASLKAKLAANRDTSPLFDTNYFARNIEAAYVTMWQRVQDGQPPAHFAVG